MHTALSNVDFYEILNALSILMNYTVQDILNQVERELNVRLPPFTSSRQAHQSHPFRKHFSSQGFYSVVSHEQP